MTFLSMTGGEYYFFLILCFIFNNKHGDTQCGVGNLPLYSPLVDYAASGQDLVRERGTVRTILYVLYYTRWDCMSVMSVMIWYGMI